MKEPNWISKKAALALHERQLAEHGGLTGIRSEELLESSLSRPKNLFFYTDKRVSYPRMAASCIYGIVTTLPFIAGNRRTALVTGITFLIINGRNLFASQEEKYKTIIALASGKMDEGTLAKWFEENSKKT